MKTLFGMLLVAVLSMTAYSETKLPLGATDLAPNPRLEEFKEKKNETIIYQPKLNLRDIEWEKEIRLFRLTCFNGQVGSGSKCSTTLKINKELAVEELEGGLTCGYPDSTSEIKWKLQGMDGENMKLLFTRLFPVGMDNASVSEKEIVITGESIVIFQDEHQIVVIEPISEPSGAINSEAAASPR